MECESGLKTFNISFLKGANLYRVPKLAGTKRMLSGGVQQIWNMKGCSNSNNSEA